MMTELDVYAMWAERAEGDWKAAGILSSAKDAEYNAACFHYQPCAEKYIKALLCRLGVPFKKSHDLGELVERLPRDKRPTVSSEELETLSEHAVDSRYPGVGDELGRQDADAAQHTSGKIREFVLSQAKSA
jgi:HEPN domain-containing protein